MTTLGCPFEVSRYSEHCFGAFVVVSRRVVRMHAWPDGSSNGVGVVNYGPPHGDDGWSMSDGTQPFACVRSGGSKQSVGCVVAVSRMVGARSVESSCGTFM